MRMCLTPRGYLSENWVVIIEMLVLYSPEPGDCGLLASTAWIDGLINWLILKDVKAINI